METVLSTDGTRTTYDRTGQGPALIVIVGAFDERVTGEQSPGDAARGQSLADTLLHARLRVLEGRCHDIVPAVVVPVLVEFFAP